MLTSSQLKSLRYDLQTLANIEYYEVMDELLDHYASLTEQFITEGESFEEASKKAWIKLGSGQGISHIQERYKKLLMNQMQVQHWTIVRHYFRWPTLVTTLLTGTLTYLFAEILSTRLLGLFFLVFSFAPYLLFIPDELKLVRYKRIKKKTLLKSLKREVVYRQARYGNYLYLAVVQIPGLIVSFTTNDSRFGNHPFLFEWHVGLSAALTFVAFIYLLTFIKLYKNHSAYFPATTS